MKTYFKAYIPLVIAILMIGIGFVLYLEDASATFKIGGSQSPSPLKEAKLNIEHNATDEDTGFQGSFDSEGWSEMTIKGPGGKALQIKGLGSLKKLGLTELFFETVEPENADVSIADMLSMLPEGNYIIEGKGMEAGEKTGNILGTAWLTHKIPNGPVLLLPEEDAVVPTNVDLLMDWEPVTKTITGEDVTIISYQLIVEQVTEPHPHIIGKIGSLSIYLPANVTSNKVPKEFLESGEEYNWEVLAIEESGNQTLSSGKFSAE